MSLLSYMPLGLYSDGGVLLHVAGQLLCLGQGSVWCEAGNWSRRGAAPHLRLQNPDQQVWLVAWSTLVWTQHLSGKFTGCVSQTQGLHSKKTLGCCVKLKWNRVPMMAWNFRGCHFHSESWCAHLFLIKGTVHPKHSVIIYSAPCGWKVGLNLSFKFVIHVQQPSYLV